MNLTSLSGYLNQQVLLVDFQSTDWRRESYNVKLVLSNSRTQATEVTLERNYKPYIVSLTELPS